jgi:hypothetical protein
VALLTFLIVVIGSHYNLCLYNDLFHLHVIIIPAGSDLNAEAFISTSFSNLEESDDGV